jgi:CDP-diacylglycerol--glycerol-3-phosphate 3-phosphatidyltransferase
MFDQRLRPSVEKRLKPVGDNIRRSGITADHLTLAGLVMAVFTCLALANGWFPLAILFGALTALPDVLDGAVAKASGTASARGAFFDSVADRVADALLLGGIAWYLAGLYDPAIVLLPMAVLAASMLISYERAKAEALGFDARGGLMERAERFIALAIGALFPALWIPVLWVMLALTLFTAGQRFVSVWRQASAPRPAPRSTWRTRRPGRTTTAERARARRERWTAARQARRDTGTSR